MRRLSLVTWAKLLVFSSGLLLFSVSFYGYPPCQPELPSALSRTYLYSSYLVEESGGDTLILMGVRHCSNRCPPILLIRKKGGVQKRVQLKRMDPADITCPWRYSPACAVGGFFFVFDLEASDLEGETKLLLSSSEESGSAVEIPPPSDLRISPEEKPLTLAVCVAALFLYSDWQQLAQFLELWINLGAEKIFLYVQSTLPEIMHLLEAYERENLVEIVTWPPLPSKEANRNFYYLGQVFVNNECMYRARQIAKFVAIADLDEVFLPSHGRSLPQTLRNLAQEHPEGSTFLLRNIRLYLESPVSPDSSSEPENSQPIRRVHFESESFAKSPFVVAPQKPQGAKTRPKVEEQTKSASDEFLSASQGSPTQSLRPKFGTPLEHEMLDRVFKTVAVSPNQNAKQGFESVADLSLSHLHVVKVEKFIWRSGYLSKFVVRPERVYQVHIHTDKSRNFGDKVVVSPKDLAKWHIRKVKRENSTRGTTRFDYSLRDLAIKSERSFRKRMLAANLTDLKIPTSAKEIPRILETCITVQSLDKSQCLNPSACAEFPGFLWSHDWITPGGNAWIEL